MKTWLFVAVLICSCFSYADEASSPDDFANDACPTSEEVARGIPIPAYCSIRDTVDPLHESRQELQWLLALLDPRDLFVDHLLHLFEGLGPDLETVVDQEGRGRSDAEGLAP